MSGGLSHSEGVGSCGSVIFYGDRNPAFTFNFLSIPITDPHYGVRMMFEAIFLDNWNIGGQEMDISVGSEAGTLSLAANI